jgi:hypothetical protein
MSTTALKLIALVLMVIDHTGEFIPNMPVALRWIGRLSAPIFVFCTVEGFSHTRSKKRYMLRLYTAGVLMGLLDRLVPYIGHAIPNFSPEKTWIQNNIFRTLFSILVICFLIDLFQKKDKNFKKYLLIYGVWQAGSYCILDLIPKLITPSALSETILSFLPNLLGSIYYLEGGWLFLLLGALLYLVKDHKKTLAVGYFSFCFVYFLLTVTQFIPRVLIKLLYFVYQLDLSGFAGLSNAIFNFEDGLSNFCMSHSGLETRYSSDLNLFFKDYQWMMIGALPFLLAYNGQKGKGYKYFFYFFYPIHIFLLYFIGGLIGGMSG